MSINIDSETWCRKAYLNYYCNGNSMGLTADEMSEITGRWSSKVTSWQATISDDENQYVLEDSKVEDSKEAGKKKAQENTEFDGKSDKKGSDAGTATNWAAGGLAAAAGLLAGIIALTGKLTKCATACIWVALGAALALVASAGALFGAHVNKDAANACEKLSTEELPNAQAALEESQADMEAAASNIEDLSDEAGETNEDANDSMLEQKTEYDAYRTSYEALKTKAASGEKLTESEKALYQKLVQYMTETGEEINETQEGTSETVNEIYDEMGTYQENYDCAAETIGEVQGVTEFAAGFDEDTKEGANHVKNSCDMGIVGASAAGAAGALGMAKAIPKMSNPFSFAIGSAEFGASIATIAAGITAGILFGQVKNEQKNFEDIAQTEIDIRQDTETFNEETQGVYDEEIESYDTIMTGVEDLELEVPDDVEVPEDTTLPATATGTGFPEGTPDPLQSQNKPEEDDKDKKPKTNNV